jgi:hypothetical protein
VRAALPRLRLALTSPCTSFNQVSVAHNATKEDKVEALSKKKREVEERLRQRS